MGPRGQHGPVGPPVSQSCHLGSLSFVLSLFFLSTAFKMYSYFESLPL